MPAARGDFEGARAMQERVLGIRTRLLGDEHADTSLAVTLIAGGDFAGALAMQERGLAATTLVFGSRHPNAKAAARDLAAIRAAIDDQEKH